MTLTATKMQELVDQTIFGEEYMSATLSANDKDGNQVMSSPMMTFVFSSNIEKLKEQYQYAQSMIDKDHTVPGPFAFVFNKNGALLVLEIK